MKSCPKTIFLCFYIVIFFISCSTKQPVQQQVVLMAHSHNDYEREHPLFDALEQRFISIEADIHLVNDRLYVAHDTEDIIPNRTLQSLYLDPLRERIRKNGGFVYNNATPLILFIDIKTEADSTYLKLSKILKEYNEIFTCYQNGAIRRGAVEVVISGNRQLEIMKTQTGRYASYDGRITDLNSDMPASLISFISDNWTKHFPWNGVGLFPAAEKQKLHAIVKRAHDKGRKVRFWKTDVDTLEYQLNLWRELLEAGVDIINTDKIIVLKDFLVDQKDSAK